MALNTLDKSRRLGLAVVSTASLVISITLPNIGVVVMLFFVGLILLDILTAIEKR